MSKVWYANPAGTAPAQGLYSHVGLVQGGTLAFIAGQLAVGPTGEVVGKDDFSAQFHQVFSNLQDVLKGLDADYSRVVKFTTYLARGTDLDRFMELRRALFPKFFSKEPYPPNTLLIVARLVKPEFLIEVEAVAALG